MLVIVRIANIKSGVKYSSDCNIQQHMNFNKLFLNNKTMTKKEKKNLKRY